LRFIGLVNSATANSGIWFGPGTQSNKAAIFKYDGTTLTLLAQEGGTSLGPIIATIGLTKFDLQIINFGSSSIVNLFIGGALVISYSGSTAISGISNLDCVGLGAGSGVNNTAMSEIIVADESTLGFQGLVTMAPNGNGASQQWSNPGYTNVNPTTVNDANSTYTNATGQDEQLTTNNMPTGIFQIKAVKVVARAAATSGATATGLKLGFNNTNNSVAAEGSAHTLGSGFSPVEEYFATDPTNGGAAFGANLNGYQIELRSA